MTFEELQKEANIQGYSLIKKQKYISLNKCPKCGRKPQEWIKHVNGKIYHQYRCDCGNSAEKWCLKDREARSEWNLYVEHHIEETWEEPEINPCRGCKDYDWNGGCKSNGGCGMDLNASDINVSSKTDEVMES